MLPQHITNMDLFSKVALARHYMDILSEVALARH